MTFGGNQNAKIAAIDTSGGIVCSRTSGQTPCFIQVSASAITCTGVVVNTDGSTNIAHDVVPFEDMEYSWNFGDLSGIELFTDPVTDASVNANSAQTGGEAFYVYRSAGTYTVTLTIRGKNGTGFTTAQKTQDITVTTFSASGGEAYADSNAAGPGTGTIGDPFVTVAQMNTFITGGQNRALHIKGGSHWSGTTGISIDPIANRGFPLRIDKYGGGADWIIEITSGSNPAFFLRNGGSLSQAPKSDIVVSNGRLRRSGTGTGTPLAISSGNVDAAITDLYFDNCHVVTANTSGGSGFWVAAIFNGNQSRFGMWGGSITSEDGDISEGIGLYCETVEWVSFVGLTINGTGGDPVLDHHMYPSIRYHALFRYMNFGDGPDRSYCINGNWNTLSGGLETAQYWLISDCNMTGTSFAHDGSSSGPHRLDKVRFTDYVVQNNAIHDLRSGGALFYCIISATWRNNRVWNVPNYFITPGTDSDPELGDLIKLRIYGNYNYTVANTAGVGVINLSYGGAGTYTLPQQITDNITYVTLVAANVIGVGVADQQSSGSIIDRNQYWVPNDGDAKAWHDISTDKTFAQWQGFGFDVNGSVADPQWTDPANGDFSTPTVPTVLTPVGGRTRSYHDPDIFDKQPRPFSRKYFNELKAAEAAQKAAQERADRLKSRQAKQALNRAAQEAAEAIAHAKETEVELARMTAALEAARSASDLAETIRQADLAIQYAREIQEEDEAIALLMLH